MAFGGASAAARADAADRCAHEPGRERSRRSGPTCGVPAGPATIRLERWPQCPEDTRWGEDDVDRERQAAAELVALAPDIVFASGTLSVAAVKHVNRTLPIVFVGVTDPVGSGLVDTLARPGGNTTGFMIYEYSFGGKRLELLKQIAPSVTRVAVLRDPANSAGISEFAAIQAAAQSLKMEVKPVDSRDVGEIERVVTTFARSPNGGLILTPNAAVSVRRDLIITLAAQHKLPTVYPFR